MREKITNRAAIKEGENEILEELKEKEEAERPRTLKEQFKEMDEQQYKEWKAFESDNWSALDCRRPFYMEKTNLPDGTIKTVGCTKTQPDSPSLEWFKIDGDVVPPENCWSSRSVMVVKEGKWETIKSEQN